MSGKRLLDAIALFNVSRSVASKHLALRKHQLDRYSRTSSVAKGVQSQTDRVALTIKAASVLAGRFNEPESQQDYGENASTARNHASSPSPGHESAKKSSAASSGGQGLDQDLVNQVPSEELDVKQRTGDGPTRPDRTIPWGGLSSSSAAASLSPGESINIQQQAGFQTPAGPPQAPTSRDREPPGSSSQVAQDQNEPSEEMVKDLFHSPRIARLLANNKDKPFSKYDLAAKYGKTTPPETSSIKSNQMNDNISTLTAASRSKFTPILEEKNDEDLGKLGADIASDVAASESLIEPQTLDQKPASTPYQLIESRVPSSRLGRLWQYGGLATSMAFGAVGESLRRATGSSEDSNGSLVLSAGNMERLVAKLSKMRGAALKLGQMMSIQDSKTLPPAIQEVLQRVQDRADYMPASQRDKVLVDNLGSNWRELFESFEEIPMAAASIGQVHGAILKSTGQRVAVKVQYPGVADSIDSDLSNLSILLNASRLLPKGLYLDKTIANARTELAWECDYFREAECGERFRKLLEDDTSTFTIPKVITEASGQQVLTMERLDGIAVTKIQNFTQAQRDWIGTQFLRLCFREISEFKYMQTDPNWTNFLYNAKTNRLELLDFGATRAYPSEFINTYMRTLRAAARSDRDACRDLSLKLGYLTGFESPTMVKAHVDSILTIAEPFTASSPDVYDFKNQTITDRVRELIPVMIRERLTPPPEETYSLHRKLSGAFLLCARLGSQVRAKELFAAAVDGMEGLEKD